MKSKSTTAKTSAKYGVRGHKNVHHVNMEPLREANGILNCS